MGFFNDPELDCLLDDDYDDDLGSADEYVANHVEELVNDPVSRISKDLAFRAINTVFTPFDYGAKVLNFFK